MFVLDTKVVSELRRGGRSDPRVRAWASRIPATSLFLSVVTVLELEVGVLRMERRDARQGAALRRWLEHSVLVKFAGRVLAVDGLVARRCAVLHVPDPCPERDAWIAATALVHGMTVATRNVGDFRASGVSLVNPWDSV